jgi:hypothetical protein
VTLAMAERKPYLLRIDPGLWAELEAWAKDELRSVNGQIEYILRQAVSKRKGAAAAAKAKAGAASTDPPGS